MMKRYLLSGLFIACATGAAHEAMAGGGCDCGTIRSFVNEAKADTISNINSRISSAETAIVETIKTGTAQISAYQKLQIKANADIADAQAQINTQENRRRVESDAIKGRYDIPSSACYATQSAFVAGGMHNVAYRWRQAATEQGSLWDSADTKSPSRSGVVGALVYLQKRSDETQGKTAKAESFLQPATYATPADMQIAQDYVQSVINPQPLPPVPSNEANRVLAAKVTTLRARQSLARWPFEQEIANRAPTGQLATMTKAIAKTLKLDSSYQIPDSISLNQLTDIMVKSRYENPDWYKGVSEMSPEAVTREIAFELALAIHLLNENLTWTKQSTLLGGALYAQKLESDTKGEIVNTNLNTVQAGN